MTSTTSIICMVFFTFVVGEVVPAVVVPASGGKENFIVSRICLDGSHRAVKAGHQWQDRCMKCYCHPTRGSVCETPKCAIPYKPYHNKTCSKVITVVIVTPCWFSYSGLIINKTARMLIFKYPRRSIDHVYFIY